MRVLHHDSSNLGYPLTFLFNGLVSHVDELELPEASHGCYYNETTRCEAEADGVPNG